VLFGTRRKLYCIFLYVLSEVPVFHRWLRTDSLLFHPYRNAYDQPIIARNDNSMRTEYVPEVIAVAKEIHDLTLHSDLHQISKINPHNRFGSFEDPRAL